MTELSIILLIMNSSKSRVPLHISKNHLTQAINLLVKRPTVPNSRTPRQKTSEHCNHVNNHYPSQLNESIVHMNFGGCFASKSSVFLNGYFAVSLQF